MDKFKNYSRGCLTGLLVFIFIFAGFVGAVNSAEYSGLIAVKNGVPLTPSPWPPKFDGKDNLRFFLDDTNPSPVAAGLNSLSIVAEGTASDAIYNIIPFGTITVLADDGTNYGRTSSGKNINSGLVETMTFVGGAYKTYELVAMTLLYKKEAPIAPLAAAVDVTLDGYRAGDFKPLIKVTVGSYSDSDHEKSSPYYKYEIFEGTDLLDSLETDDSTWRPDSSKLSATDTNRTYTIKVKTHNWFGYSVTSTDKDILVPSPGAGVVPPHIFTFELAENAPLSRQMVSLPYNLDYANGEELAGDINTKSPPGEINCQEVDRFNRETQKFESVSYNSDLGFWLYDPGPDPFPIVPGEGYMLYYIGPITNWTPKTK